MYLQAGGTRLCVVCLQADMHIDLLLRPTQLQLRKWYHRRSEPVTNLENFGILRARVEGSQQSRRERMHRFSLGSACIHPTRLQRKYSGVGKIQHVFLVR